MSLARTVVTSGLPVRAVLLLVALGSASIAATSHAGDEAIPSVPVACAASGVGVDLHGIGVTRGVSRGGVESVIGSIFESWILEIGVNGYGLPNCLIQGFGNALCNVHKDNVLLDLWAETIVEPVQ